MSTPINKQGTLHLRMGTSYLQYLHTQDIFSKPSDRIIQATFQAIRKYQGTKSKCVLDTVTC